VLAVLMALAWARQRRTHNAGTVDLVWTAGVGALGVAHVVVGDGWLPRRVLVGVLVGTWAARLLVHLAARMGREREDGRYRMLRAELGEGFDRWTFVFFQAQALLAALLGLVFGVLAGAEAEHLRPQDWAGIALWLVAFVGETVADRQLDAWRADHANLGRTCRAGLWRLSRHPNYFFEWLHWMAWPLLGLGLAGGWPLWLAPAAMLFLVLKVTGIPPTEKQALASRGDDYRAYQRTTNAFFPGPPQADPSTSTSEARP
jgi:steroid 5-alpha reductase family enzyme